MLGAHLEGPFLNKQKKGAHPIQHIRPFAKGAGDRALRHSLPHQGAGQSGSQHYAVMALMALMLCTPFRLQLHTLLCFPFPFQHATSDHP